MSAESDPFDSVSIYRSTDARPGSRARRIWDGATATEDAWCVVRFSPANNRYGCPLKDLSTGTNETLRGGAFGVMGFCDDALPYLMFEDEARNVAARSPLVAPGLLRDAAVPLSSVTWRVVLHDSYDNSRVEAYRGNSYQEALHTFGVGRVLCAAAGVYLKTILEGVVNVESVS